MRVGSKGSVEDATKGGTKGGIKGSMKGRYGPYGGQYVPETLMSALEELEGAWLAASADPEFLLELKAQQHAFVGRPTPLYAAERLSQHFGGARIHLKREDLCHTGAHKL